MHLDVELANDARGLDAPVRREVVLRTQGADAAQLVAEQLPDLLLLVVHDRRAGDHGIASATGLAIVRQRQGEAVRGRHRPASNLEPSNAVALRAREIEHVVGASDDVEVVSRHPGVDGHRPAGVGDVVARAELEVVAELTATDANGAEGVVVRIERLHARRRDRTRVDRGVEGDARGGGEVRVRSAALHLEHEVEQRRVDHATRVGAPGDVGAPDRRRHPRDGRVMLRCGGGEHRGGLGMARGAHEPRELGDHPPSATFALEANVGDRDALHPVLGLHEKHAVDRGIGHLLVGVPVRDQIDARHLARDVRRDVVARQARRGGIVGRRLGQPAVHRDDDHLCAGRARLTDRGAHRRDDVPEHDTAAEVVAVPDHRAGRRRADDADLDAAPLDERPRAKGRAAVGALRVCCEEREPGLAPGAFEERHAVVELVIADGGRVVAHRVHRRDHRMARIGRRDARGNECERIALDDVPRVDENDAARVRAPQGVHDRGGAGEPHGGVRGVLVVVPATNATVDVGRRRDDELRCRGEGSGRRGDDRGTRAPTRDRERQRDERGWYPHSEKLLGGGWRGERPLVDGLRTHRHTTDGARAYTRS